MSALLRLTGVLEVAIETVRSEIDIFVSSTGIFNIISAIKHVDHDELLLEFRQSGAHAPWLQVAAIETAVSETDIFASSTCTTSSLCEPVVMLYGLVPVTRSSRTVYIFISLRMPVVLLKFPLVAIFVWVARARTFLNTDQEMGEFMSQSAVRQSGLPRNRGQCVASVAKAGVTQVNSGIGNTSFTSACMATGFADRFLVEFMFT